MSVLKYCNIDQITVTPKMEGYLDRVNSKVDLGNLLAISIASSQFIQIFSGKVSAGRQLEKIYSHDWEVFSSVLLSTHFLTRNEVNKIADEARLFSFGDEAKFWDCVYEATR